MSKDRRDFGTTDLEGDERYCSHHPERIDDANDVAFWLNCCAVVLVVGIGILIALAVLAIRTMVGGGK
jgi:hypothetical protein